MSNRMALSGVVAAKIFPHGENEREVTLCPILALNLTPQRTKEYFNAKHNINNILINTSNK